MMPVRIHCSLSYMNVNVKKQCDIPIIVLGCWKQFTACAPLCYITPYRKGAPPISCYEKSCLVVMAGYSHPASVLPPAGPRSLDIQHVVEVGDVTNREPQDLNLGQLLVWRQRWEQFSQLCKGHVEGHHTHPLPGGVRGSIFSCRAPPPPLLLPAEHGHVRLALSALSGFGRHGPALHVQSVQEGLRVRQSPRRVGHGRVGTEHHAGVRRPERSWRRTVDQHPDAWKRFGFSKFHHVLCIHASMLDIRSGFRVSDLNQLLYSGRGLLLGTFM